MFDLITKTKHYFVRRKYTEKLPKQLRELYGTQDKYSPTQITLALKKAGLTTKYRKLAYEMYLTKDEIRSFRKKSRKRYRVSLPLASVKIH